MIKPLAHFALFALIATTACKTGPETRDNRKDGAEIPVRKVILYQNGVGYIERAGKVNGDTLSLQVRPTQINDLLKSLTVIDKSKGRAVSISLPLEKTGDQILEELPDQVKNASGLLDVLKVFRGARAEVDGSEGRVTGRVLGVEPMEVIEGEEKKIDHRLTLETDAGQLRVYPVSAIQSLEIMDKTLAIGLQKSLDVSLNAGDWKPINLSVRLAGEKKHDLVASYIVEMPLWKPAYRLVYQDGREPLLQGWAVVDNVSGEDWNDVDLSLVAGNPTSFIFDLHRPQFTDRVDLTPQRPRMAAAPIIEQAGRAKDQAPSKVARRESKKKAKRSRPKPSAPKMDYAAEMEPMEEAALGSAVGGEFDLDDALEDQGVTEAEGTSLGALFRYDLPDPVTIPDRSSTLVAIVNKRVKGKEVVLFRPQHYGRGGGNKPLRAMLFTNNSGFTLETGPVTLYSQGTFVGEAFMKRMDPGMTTFLTFSGDDTVNLRTENFREEEGLKLVKIVDGMLVSEVLEINRTVYKVTNQGEKDVTAYVKVSMQPGAKLRDKPKDTVETGNALFLPVKVKADSNKDLEAAWVKPVKRKVSIDTRLSTTLLKMVLEAGKAPPKVQKAIQEILKVKSRLTELGEDASRIRREHRDMSNDQRRVRDNLELLRKTKGNKPLMDSLVKKLVSIERRLGVLSGKLVKISEEEAELKAKMKVMIKGITLKDAE
jgi:hypothetical protein